ncbi:DUF3179 domain-containing protein, partial [Patescibacteria group bacterium]|nr:DUF3179 domain-containing protein [Patescibacteria group bacterium]
GRLPEKEVVIGVYGDGSQLAILKSKVAQERVLNLEVGGEPIVAFWDNDLEAVLVYARISDQQTFNLSRSGKGYVDQSGTLWSVDGFSEDGRALEWMPSLDAMWFSWVSFFPETERPKGSLDCVACRCCIFFILSLEPR